MTILHDRRGRDADRRGAGHARQRRRRERRHADGDPADRPAACGKLLAQSRRIVQLPAAADYNGDDSFTYVASDGIRGTPVTVTITVNAVNDAPARAAQYAHGDRRGQRRAADHAGAAARHRIRYDGPALEARNLAILAGAGSLIDHHDGTWSYTPALDDDTSVTFSYRGDRRRRRSGGHDGDARHHAGQRRTGRRRAARVRRTGRRPSRSRPRSMRPSRSSTPTLRRCPPAPSSITGNFPTPTRMCWRSSTPIAASSATSGGLCGRNLAVPDLRRRHRHTGAVAVRAARRHLHQHVGHADTADRTITFTLSDGTASNEHRDRHRRRRRGERCAGEHPAAGPSVEANHSLAIAGTIDQRRRRRSRHDDDHAFGRAWPAVDRRRPAAPRSVAAAAAR